MVTLYKPAYKLTINDFDVTTSINPYLVSITYEDFFDSNFTVSRLELIIHAKYARSSAWQYKDKLKLELWWEPYPSFKLVTGYFYVDYVEDLNQSGGVQLFRVSALEADPELGFTYGVDEIILTNKTTIQALTDFKNLFGLTMTANINSNVYMGVIKDWASSPPLNNVEITFTSYAEMLRYICNTFGYFGNLSGKNLEIIPVESTFSSSSRFFVPDFKDLYNFEAKQSFNQLYKTYQAVYVDRNNSDTLTLQNLQPAMQAQLNQKTNKIEYEDAYYNFESVSERLYGAMYNDFYAGFETRLTCSAFPEITAGKVFLLNSTYSQHEGYYRCTRARHIVSASGWICEIDGFPLSILQSTTAQFKLQFTGQYQNPPSSNNIELSQVLSGTNTTITATQLNNYAKYLNTNYNLSLGSIFISEGNKAGNSIKPDIAFCLALYKTENYTYTYTINKFNPGAIGNATGTDLHTFANWTEGIRGQIQHMFAFANATGSPADPIVDPRYNFVTRGSATTIDDLSLKWDSTIDLSVIVREKMINLYKYLYPDFNVYFID